MKVNDLFDNVFEDFQELQQENNGIYNTRVWQIQWSITEDENENKPQYIFAQNKNDAMAKLSSRLSLFDSNIQIESVKEIEWDSVISVNENDNDNVVDMQKWKRKKNIPVFDVSYDDLYRNFIHLWNTGDEWGDTLGTLFAVAEELYKRGDGPPDSWQFRPGPGSIYDQPELGQEKYDMAVAQQQGEEDDESSWMDLKHADTPTLEKFGELLLDIRDTLKDEGKDY